MGWLAGTTIVVEALVPGVEPEAPRVAGLRDAGVSVVSAMVSR